ncbi:MAG: hypothetical protein GEEBNDBF_01003 [bacterium]|nr:hypothetical protein [bacterium]
MRRGIVISILSGMALLACTSAALAGENVTLETSEMGPTWSLTEAIAFAQQHNYGLAASKLGLTRDEWNVYIARGIFDRTLTMGLTHSERQSEGSFGSTTTGGSETSTTTLQASAVVPTDSGGSWSLTYNTQRAEVRSSGSSSTSSNEGYNSSMNLRFRQPLLEGAGRTRTRSPIRQAEFGYQITAENLRQDFLSIEQTVTNQYLAALRAQRQVETAKLSLEVANALYRQVTAQFEAGVSARFEKTNAEGGLAAREEALIVAEQGVANALDALRQTLGLPLDAPIALDPLPGLALDLPDTVDGAWSIAASMRPEMSILRIREDLTRLQRDDAKDRLRNSLDFTATAGLDGAGDDLGESIEGLDNFSWTVGLEYTIPLGRDRRAKGQYQQSSLSLEQLSLQRQETESQIQTALSQLLRDVQVAGERLRITGTGVRVAEERLQNERARLDLGLSTTTLVLDVEEDLAQARRAAIDAELDLLASQARLFNTLGLSLLESAIAGSSAE